MEYGILLTGFLSRAYFWFLDHFAGTYTKRILIEAIQLLGKLWPYLLVGILFTTLVKMYISKGIIARVFDEKGAAVSILLAALIGVASPIGSYVIIPLSAALFMVGVPLPPLMALMIASPLINPNLFLLTSGAMGIEMALMRTLAAFTLGVVAGYLTQWIMHRRPEWFKVVLKDNQALVVKGFTSSHGKRSLAAFWREALNMTRYISKYFFLAIVLAAVIKIMVNPDYIARAFSENQFMAVMLSTGAGVPFYVCGGAAIPVVQSLAELGMSGGAVLAFFISGPMTKISNLVILNAAFSSRVLILYLIIGLSGAMLFGLLYNYLT